MCIPLARSWYRGDNDNRSSRYIELKIPFLGCSGIPFARPWWFPQVDGNRCDAFVTGRTVVLLIRDLSSLVAYDEKTLPLHWNLHDECHSSRGTCRSCLGLVRTTVVAVRDKSHSFLLMVAAWYASVAVAQTFGRMLWLGNMTIAGSGPEVFRSYRVV